MASTESKTTPVRLALIGADTLLGKDLHEVLEQRTGAAISGYSPSAEANVAEAEEEAIYPEPLDEKTIAKHQAIVLAGSEAGALKAYLLARDAPGHVLVIDCIGQLESQPEARIVAPLVEEPDLSTSWLLVLAHPAASAIALVLTRLARYSPLQEVVANIFEPASERGKEGVSELHQQTTGLLAFKPLDKNVFDAQLSFNLLPRYGEDAPVKLANVEQRIERHIATILSKHDHAAAVPMPSLRLIQASVFHGYGVSLWVAFQKNVSAEEIAHALASAQIEVRGEKDETPNNASTAGQSGLIVGDIRVDRNNPRAAWLWLVGDNLRLTSDAAAEIVLEIRTVRK